MALPQPVIHCVVDQEPTNFHQSDIEETTVSFAVNLSFEYTSDDPDEANAKSKFNQFLQTVQRVRFRVYSVDADSPAPAFVGPVDETISAKPYATAKDLFDWLVKFAPVDESTSRYWSTPAASTAQTTIDAEKAAAAHRLRAAHSWNAPVGHKFALTHIVRIARAAFDPPGKRYIVLPYFDEPADGANAPRFVAFLPPLDPLHPPPPPPVNEILVDYSYDPLGGFGDAVCRTNRIGAGSTKLPFQPSDVDKGLSKDGYFFVDSDVENVRRLLVWLEERTASLMTANSGLFPHGDDKQDPEFQQLFKIRYQAEPEAKPTKGNWKNEAAPWYVVARLISALDNLVIALLKPTVSGASTTEGEILAPLVTALIRHLDGTLVLDCAQLAGSIRKILTSNSPLLSNKGRRPLVGALRHIYGLSAPPKVIDERSLVNALLEDFHNPNQAIDPESIPYLQSIEDKDHHNSAQIVSRLLLDLEQVLHDEAGAEAAIVRLIETAEIGNNRFAALLANALTQDPALLPKVQSAVGEAWSEYRALLDGPFNGAEAIRRAAGSTFVLALLNFQESHKPPRKKGKEELNSSEYLRWIVRAGQFYKRRFFPPIKKPVLPPKKRPDELFALTDVLLKPDTSVLPSSTQSALRLRLRAAFLAAMEPLKAFDASNLRFIPDSAPHPIPIQIAANIDGSKIDEFGKHFNGIAVAIERADLGTSPDRWAYANLADLGWTEDKGKPKTDVRGAIHPMLPAASDGRNPMFIDYQGFPFADRADDARIVENDNQPHVALQLPFYRHDPHEPQGTADFAQVPRLAYGRNFKTFSFPASNAGSLPLALQLAADSPWMPKLDPPPAGADDSGLVGKSSYQRRTAIAQMSLIETPVKQRSLRLGAGITGVKPLAEDYPRVGMMADSDDIGVRDIMRETHGAGKMVASRNFEWKLSDVEFGGTPQRLTLRFFERPANGPTDNGDSWLVVEEGKFPGFARQSEIAIGVEFKEKDDNKALYERRLYARCGGKTVYWDQLLTDGVGVAGWLRLELKAAPGKPAKMAFANLGSQKTDNVNDPLLLLAPNSDDWASGLSNKVELTVTTPRVGYLDFERWFANADLRNGTFPQDKPKSVTSSRLFEQMLVMAYVMRHLDTRLAAALDRLPDPAVDQVRIELTPLDALTEVKPDLGKANPRIHLLGKKLQDFVLNFSDIVDDMLKAKAHWHEGDQRPDPIPWSPQNLLDYVFRPLELNFQFKITLQPGSPLSLGPDEAPFSARVPEGVVARLSIDSLVPAGHFEQAAGSQHPSVFHAGVKQYASRRLKTYLGFPAAAVRIETMYDGIKEISEPDRKKVNKVAIKLAADMISVEGVEKNRKYDIMTAATAANDTDRRRWRLLHEIDVTTQRWRTTGRPIYHYVNPRQYRYVEKPEEDPEEAPKEALAEAAVPHPALRLDFGPDASDELAQFELEAFFDRPDIDAQTITKTLDPLPARTVLQEIQWNPESATYFRHRFRLRSRYASALKLRNNGEVIAWPDKKDANAVPDVWSPARAWTMRVAMLADLAKVKMTRPQLRALIPLTTAPGGDEVRRPAPPVAAILQEPPFARGGLADRIASEVKTGFSYGFSYDDQDPDDKHHLEILDSRKEGGPDPRLDYRRLDKETAYGLVLRSEGPMGLTFDNIDAPAPAYPNAMFSLLPATLNSNKENKTVDQTFEEMFVGAAMRRYIDPWWTTEARQNADKLDGERCWWLVHKQFDSLPVNLLTYAVPGNDQVVPPLLVIDREEASIVVSASRLAVDGIGPSVTNDQKDLVAILKVDRASLLGLAVLHQPVAPGRYSASVFVTTSSANTKRGEINAPLMLASFEWSPPLKDKNGRPKPASATISGPDMPAYLTLASAPTFIRWTRTGRDVDFLHLPIIEKDQATGVESWRMDRKHLRELVATLEDNHFSFKLKGVEEPVWLCPSTFNNPYPIHVHRHLAIISSYFLKELGRPAELFCRTALVRSKQAMLVTADGKQADLAKNSPDQVVRVVEFETPAQILCDRNMNAPTKYKEAYLDLLSTGFVAEDGANVHLYFRIVGPPAHQRAFTGLQVHLRRPSAGDDAIVLNWTNKPQSFVVGAYLSLRQKKGVSANPTASVEARLLRSDGSLDPAPNLPVIKRMEDPGLFVSVGVTAPAGHEFWTDVSLLHSSDDLGPWLDFDWLFSAPAGQADDPAVSVSPASLNMMREAQARVVAVSLPVGIDVRF
jgi:hypothetical protein